MPASSRSKRATPKRHKKAGQKPKVRRKRHAPAKQAGVPSLSSLHYAAFLASLRTEERAAREALARIEAEIRRLKVELVDASVLEAYVEPIRALAEELPRTIFSVRKLYEFTKALEYAQGATRKQLRAVKRERLGSSKALRDIRDTSMVLAVKAEKEIAAAVKEIAAQRPDPRHR